MWSQQATDGKKRNKKLVLRNEIELNFWPVFFSIGQGTTKVNNNFLHFHTLMFQCWLFSLGARRQVVQLHFMIKLHRNNKKIINQSMKINLTKIKGYFCSRATWTSWRYINVKFLVFGFLSSRVSTISLTLVSYVSTRITNFENNFVKISWRLTIKLVDSTYHFNTKSSTDCNIATSVGQDVEKQG